jgi:hypothetical protein
VRRRRIVLPTTRTLVPWLWRTPIRPHRCPNPEFDSIVSGVDALSRPGLTSDVGAVLTTLATAVKSGGGEGKEEFGGRHCGHGLVNDFRLTGRLTILSLSRVLRAYLPPLAGQFPRPTAHQESTRSCTRGSARVLNERPSSSSQPGHEQSSSLLLPPPLCLTLAPSPPARRHPISN